MVRLGLGAKPDVLRCSRCGRFVDWEDARLQIICSCRPHLPLPSVLVRPCEPPERDAVLTLFRRDFGHTSIIAFGQPETLETAPAITAWMKGDLAGALAYRLLPDELLVVALATDPMWQRSGVGGHLLDEAEAVAAAQQRRRVIVATSNDNLPSLYFYQRRGYHITDVVPGGLLPHITVAGATGFGGIPMRDEIRLSKPLV